MSRGTAKFDTMDTVKTEVDNPNASNVTRNFHKEDAKMQGGPGKKVVEHDPMKDIMGKGLVHHMQMPSHITGKGQKPIKHVGFEGAVKNAEAHGYDKESAERAIGAAKAHASAAAKARNPHLLNTRGHKVKGFTLDGTEVPTNHIGDRIMSRGNAEFTVMKGFEMEVKGGETSDTMPPDPGKDVLEDEKLSDKASKKGKRGPRVTNADDLTMAPDVDLVGEKAKQDIADGYVQDSKEGGKKGFDRFNEMVAKGIAADVEINPHNINEALGQLDAHTDAVLKGFGSKKNCRPVMKEGGAEDDESVPETKCAGKPMVKTKGPRGDLAKMIGAQVGINAATTGAIGAGTGAIAAGRGKRGEGAKEGLKAQVKPLAHPIKALRSIPASIFHPIKAVQGKNPLSEYAGGIEGAAAAGRKLRQGKPE